MIKDLDRDILTIRYNLLNLPDTIQFKNGNQIINKYDAAGRKLSTRYYTILIPEYVPLINTLTPGKTIKLAYNMDIIDETGTFYVDNVEYKFNGCDPGYYLLDRVHNPEGYVDNLSVSCGPTYNYYRRDHLGNNREVWRANTNTTVQRTQYYASGLPWATSSGNNPGLQPYKYNGKEFVEMHGYDTYDYGARGMYPAIMRFTTLDPLAEKYYSISPYAYCGDNPIMRIDPDGMDWFYHSIDGKSDPTWIWHEGHSYNTGVKDSNGKEVVLQGQEAVVIFNGSTDEKLGEGQNMYGKDAKLADVIVYGPGGEDDIQHYKGYTMSSDPTKFGVVANGDYTVNRLKPKEQLGPYGSDLVLEDRFNTKIPAMNNYNPAYPDRNPGYLTNVFIHRANNNGWAGWRYDKNGILRAVSQGCLLIAPNQWNKFHNQLKIVNSFLLQLRRK